MKYLLLLKYGEIILKGLNRPIFEATLLRNLRRVAKGYPVKIWSAQATIYVEPLDDTLDATALAERFSKVFGIVSVAIAFVAPKELDSICALAAELASQKEGKTFKINTKRADKKFVHQSPEVSMEAGAAVLQKNPHLTVDVHHPDITVNIEIRDFGAYVYLDKIAGVGGMPTGTAGRAMLLLSGGIDSPVAGYKIAKRGVELEAIHFYSYPYTSERAKEKVLDLAQILANYCGKMKVHIVPFTELQLAIHENCPADQMTILMRRIMMYVVNAVTEGTDIGALVTGECLGQVASQTMEALAVTDDAAKLPVFRPLIGDDKQEVIALARTIGTYETSILPYEDCCTVFTPKHPTTKPKLDRILRSEGLLDLPPMIQKAVEGIETVELYRR